LKKGTLDEHEMRQGLKHGMIHHNVFVICMSAKKKYWQQTNVDKDRINRLIESKGKAALKAGEIVDLNVWNKKSGHKL
jgi:hypothetical protein